MRRSGILSFALLSLLFASGAQALSFALTPDPVNFSVGSASGSITLVGGSQSLGFPVGGSQLSGTTAAGDDVLLFRVSVTSGTLDEVGLGVFPPPTFSSGSGTIAGAGVAVVAGPTNTTATRTFNFAGGGLSATSDLMFVSFASLTAGASVNFSLTSGASSTTVSAIVSVPEPTTPVLLLAGICVGGLLRRRR